MRTLQLTHQEIELIELALGQAYTDRLNIIQTNRPLLTQQVIESILQTAYQFDTLLSKIVNSEKDV